MANSSVKLGLSARVKALRMVAASTGRRQSTGLEGSKAVEGLALHPVTSASSKTVILSIANTCSRGGIHCSDSYH
jgi:hypothetical protein